VALIAESVPPEERAPLRSYASERHSRRHGKFGLLMNERIVDAETAEGAAHRKVLPAAAASRARHQTPCGPFLGMRCASAWHDTGDRAGAGANR
jgi:hypothetical protein